MFNECLIIILNETLYNNKQTLYNNNQIPYNNKHFLLLSEI